MPQLKPKDLIAALVVAAYVFLRWQHVNGGLDGAVGLILGYYFVKRQNGSDNGH